MSNLGVIDPEDHYGTVKADMPEENTPTTEHEPGTPATGGVEPEPTNSTFEIDESSSDDSESDPATALIVEQGKESSGKRKQSYSVSTSNTTGLRAIDGTTNQRSNPPSGLRIEAKKRLNVAEKVSPSFTKVFIAVFKRVCCKRSDASHRKKTAGCVRAITRRIRLFNPFKVYIRTRAVIAHLSMYISWYNIVFRKPRCHAISGLLWHQGRKKRP